MNEQILLDAIHWITRSVEVVGTAIIVAGAVMALVTFLRQLGAADDAAPSALPLPAPPKKLACPVANAPKASRGEFDYDLDGDVPF